MKKLFIIFTSFLLCICITVDAEEYCTYKEKQALQKEASHIKVNYEVKEGTLDPSLISGCDSATPENCKTTYEYFEISILNMSDKFKVEISNNHDDEILYKSYSQTQKDGTIKFDDKYIMKKITYKLKFYATDKTGCVNTLIKTYTKSMPRKNLEYYEEICQEIPDADICQKYVFFDEMDAEKFYRVAKNEIKNKEEAEAAKKREDLGFFGKFDQFLEDNKWLFIGIGAVVITGGAAFLIFRKKKVQK